MNIILWVIVLGLLYLAIRRIGAGLVGVVVFGCAIFFSIFMLDTFTIIDVRDYVDVGFYDEAKENPKEAIKDVTGKVKEGGESVVGFINEVGEKATDRYNTESIVDIDALNSPKEDKEKDDEGKNDTTEDKEDKKDKSGDESGKKSEEESEDKMGSGTTDDVPVIDGYMYITLEEYDMFVEEQKDKLTTRDYSILRALTPLLTVTYTGDEYIFHTERGVKGFYIQAKGA